MAKPELGTKRRCSACGLKFYDFKKSPILCPGCNHQFDPEQLLKSRKGRAVAKPAAKAETDENTLPEDELLEDEADTPVDEDDLPEDEDFIAAKVDEDEDDNAAAPITNDEDFIDEIDDDNVLDGEDEEAADEPEAEEAEETTD